jgi:hypothetical protein
MRDALAPTGVLQSRVSQLTPFWFVPVAFTSTWD